MKITIEEVCKMLKISKTTFYKWKNRWHIRTYQGEGKANLYDLEQIKRFLELPKEERNINK